jgi:L-asparaginase
MRITVITTGGTITKTFNENDGSLRNERPIVELIIGGLRVPHTTVTYRHILNKDSLDMTDADRLLILRTVGDVLGHAEGIVISHGTDTLEVTGEWICRELGAVPVPIILTGAMRPYEFRDSDAAQNMTEALLACRLVEPGVYVAMHNQVLRFPGVVKDRQALTFVRKQGVPARVGTGAK